VSVYISRLLDIFILTNYLMSCSAHDISIEFIKSIQSYTNINCGIENKEVVLQDM